MGKKNQHKSTVQEFKLSDTAFTSLSQTVSHNAQKQQTYTNKQYFNLTPSLKT